MVIGLSIQELTLTNSKKKKKKKKKSQVFISYILIKI
jgi:hypothetical protein